MSSTSKLMGMLSCVILLSSLLAAASNSTKAPVPSLKNVNYTCTDDDVLLCDFCNKFAERGNKVPEFPGMTELRKGLITHMNAHLSNIFQAFNARVNRRMEELNKHISSEFQRIKMVLNMTAMTKGESFMTLTRHFQNFISCVRLLSNAKFTRASAELTDITIMQLSTIVHEIYTELGTIAATTMISLGDIMGHANCLNLMDTIQNCCISRLIRVSNATNVTRTLVNASGNPANLCEDSASLKQFLDSLSELLRIQIAGACE